MTMSYKITRYHDFCAGHRVYGHENKCAQLHGHNYRVHFTVAPKNLKLDSIGRVIDFSIIKQKLCQWIEDHWDHKMLLVHFDPAIRLIREADSLSLVILDFNPTAENMAQYLVETVAPTLFNNMDVELIEVTLEETRKCSATYTKEFNDPN